MLLQESRGSRDFLEKSVKSILIGAAKRMTSNAQCVACLKIQSQVYIKAWRQKNRERENAPRRTPEARARNNAYLKLPHVRAKLNERERRRRSEDPHFKLRGNMRALLRMTLKNYGMTKKDRTFDLVGCSVALLAQHLERQFMQGMSWDNHGQWHIDHIIPVSSFNLHKRKQLLTCFHYTNLRPLWGRANLRKSAKLHYELSVEDLLPPQ